MISILKSPLLTPWTDPISGITSYLLNNPHGNWQQAFYFTNSGWTDDGKYLWFYSFYPPAQSKHLGVANFAENTIDLYPETQFSDASPAVDKNNGDVYWISGLDLYRRSPAPEAKPELISSFPADFAKSRHPRRIATHLTFSVDRKSLNFDAEVGSEWLAGDFPLDGSPPRVWKKFNICFNHAQFSPIDNNTMLIAQDGWTDAATGENHGYTHRMWILKRDGSCDPVYDYPTPKHGHEWWDPAGKTVWYIHYGHGVERIELASKKGELIWPGDIAHAYATVDGQYLVGDSNPNEKSDWNVLFYDVKKKKEIKIAAKMPKRDVPDKRYHLHPHPRFCCKDQFITYTTLVNNAVTLAIVPVEKLKQRHPCP